MASQVQVRLTWLAMSTKESAALARMDEECDSTYATTLATKSSTLATRDDHMARFILARRRLCSRVSAGDTVVSSRGCSSCIAEILCYRLYMTSQISHLLLWDHHTTILMLAHGRLCSLFRRRDSGLQQGLLLLHCRDAPPSRYKRPARHKTLVWDQPHDQLRVGGAFAPMSLLAAL